MLLLILTRLDDNAYISSQEAVLYSRAALIDVRNADYAVMGRVRGAFHLSIDDFRSEQLQQFSDYEYIFVFCMRSAVRAEHAYLIAQAAFPEKEIRIIRGGLMAIRYEIPGHFEE